MTVRDKIAMITGAGGGLGSEMARLLCENGAKVFILDLDAEKGQATADDIVKGGGSAWFVKADVTSETDWKAAVRNWERRRLVRKREHKHPRSP